ncbi:MAG: LPS assembly protein LptD [Gammaproteobacteria bacterium]
MQKSFIILIAGLFLSLNLSAETCLDEQQGTDCTAEATPVPDSNESAGSDHTVEDTLTRKSGQRSDLSFTRSPNQHTAWDTCPAPPKRDIQPATAANKDDEQLKIHGFEVTRDASRHYSISGSGILTRGSERIQADQIDYYEADSIIEVNGRLIYDNPTERILGKRGKFWINENRSEIENIYYYLYDRHILGEADRAYLDEPGITHYDDATYTTCPDGSKVWRLKAEKVVLDTNEGFGIARSARLEIHGIPLFYTPFMSFPIDDRRKTGLLVPSFGQSDNGGFDLRVPYYFNIAPHYDATLTPRYLSRRGAQLATEFRYLNPLGRGLLNYEILPEDNLTDQARSRFILRNSSRFGNHLTTNVNFDWVSDKDYLEDLGDSLSLASVPFLTRSAEARYDEDWWNLGIRFDNYQILDRNLAPDSRPYQRLPRINFAATPQVHPLGSNIFLNAELVNFRQDSRVTGKRADLWPRITLPVRRSAYEITPSLSYRFTSYDLDNQTSGTPATITRAIPVVSLDNKLFLERDFSLGKTGFTQTLEPRLFYLYAAGRDQTDIPLFDTSEPTFTYRELFAENRFTGADRMGDANQIALSLTSRLVDNQTGIERLRASIGQLFYFQNRTVTLDNSAPVDTASSDIAGELDLSLSNSWTTRADMIINPRDFATERANVRLQYHPSFRKLANIAYRYRRGEQNQIDTSILWPMGRNWHFIGRWYYDISDTKTLEKLAGIEYESCCWSAQLIARNFIENEDRDNNTAILFQIVLKGLTRIGSNIESVLEDGILGYTASPEE